MFDNSIVYFFFALSFLTWLIVWFFIVPHFIINVESVKDEIYQNMLNKLEDGKNTKQAVFETIAEIVKIIAFTSAIYFGIVIIVAERIVKFYGW